MNGPDCCVDEPTACHDAQEAFLDTCIECKIASTRGEREAAFRLLYGAYQRAGLIGPNPRQMRVTPYHLLPTTNVMVARYANQIISTLSLVEDGELGLPMEQIFADPIHERRQHGLLLAEVSCLADRRKDLRRYFSVFVRLCRLMIQCAKSRGIDQVLIAVHPRHVRFYTQYLAFDQIADVRLYPAVQNHPAVALCLDLKRLEIDRPANYERFFTVPIDARDLQPQPMPVSEQSYFRRFLADSGDHLGISESDRNQLVDSSHEACVT